MRTTSGFTLVELMIVIGIVAILVAMALPSYGKSVRKSRRADAQSTIIEFSGSAARVFTETSSYESLILPASTDYYTFSFPSTPAATSYLIQATPKDAQSKDSCGTMTITNTGKKTHTGSDAICWK